MNSPPFTGSSIDEAVSETLLSQEFNIISPTKGPLTWVLGADYTSNIYNFPRNHFDVGFPPGIIDEALNGTNNTHNWAVFGQVSYDLPAGFQLQVGGRYSEWYTNNVVSFYVPEQFFYYVIGYNYSNNQTYTGENVTGKVTLNWNLDAHNFLYAFVATGAKPGGLNNILLFGGGSTPAPFAQEYVTDYEIGWKSSWFDNHLRTQVGAYDNQFHNFQVIVAIPNLPTQSTELNVPGETKLYGVEGSAQAVFGDFSLNANVGLEHSSLATFYTQDPRETITPGTCNPTSGPATVSCVNVSGHPQTYAPDVTYNVGVQYNFKLADGDVITPIASYSHIASQWSTLFDNRSQNDYLTSRDIVNLSVGWTHAGYVVTLYSYNLTDDHYVAADLSPIRQAGAPRQFGISLLKSF
jgi:iron complex outermembrane receptor protein